VQRARLAQQVTLDQLEQQVRQAHQSLDQLVQQAYLARVLGQHTLQLGQQQQQTQLLETAQSPDDTYSLDLLSLVKSE
jgi:hypothetical protein